MRMNKAELISALRLVAKYLPTATATLMNEAATRIDVTSSVLSDALAQRDAVTEEQAAAMNTIAALMEILGTSDTLSISGQVAALKGERATLAAENAGLKSNLMFWDAEDPESPYDTPEEIAQVCSLNYGDEFVVQVAAKLPNRTYRVLEDWDCDCNVELVKGAEVETPATDSFSRELKAKGVEAAIESVMLHMNHQHVAVSEALHILKVTAQQLREAK